MDYRRTQLYERVRPVQRLDMPNEFGPNVLEVNQSKPGGSCQFEGDGIVTFPWGRTARSRVISRHT